MINIRFTVYLFLALALLLAPKIKLANAESYNVSLDTNIKEAIAVDISNSDINFGPTAPGVPKYGEQGIKISVKTNSFNGYDLYIHDGKEGGNACLMHTDGQTHIPDFPSPVDNPTVWEMGKTKGLGFTLYAADTYKELKWGEGTFYNDQLNKYSGIPKNATRFHFAPGFKDVVDNNYISFVLDVTYGQKTGYYEGDIVISVIPVL